MSTKFLGGMRGLTKFVEKIRNCANQVRARQSVHIFVSSSVPTDALRAQKSYSGTKREREREPSEIFVQIS